VAILPGAVSAAEPKRNDSALVATVAEPGRANARRIAIFAESPESPFVRSLNTLCPQRVDVFDLTAKGPGELHRDCAAMGFLVAEVRDDKQLGRLDAKSIRAFATDGGTCVLGLDEFAHLHDWQVKVQTLPNRNHIPELKPDQWQALIKAAAVINGNLPNPQAPHGLPPDGNLPEPWMNDLLRALRAEVREELPRITIVKQDPLTTGFAVGDSVPWCGNRDGRYEQRSLEVPATAPQATVDVLAVSSMDQRPVLVRERVGAGSIYALDLRSLDEPHVTWETRGSFNKYVFVGNLLGRPLRFGRYWNKKPLAEEWGPILRALAKQHRAWRVEVDGHVNGYNVYSLNLGDPSKPVWYACGMYHADDEWRSALGLLDFARYLAEHADDPAIRRQLGKYCVKLIPCQHPAMYMKSLRGQQPGPEPRVPPDPARHGRPANLVMAFTIHECDADLQYGIIPQTSTTIPLVPRIEARHRASIVNQFIEWSGAAPIQAEAKSWNGRMTDALAEEFRYYGFGIGFEPLYNIGQPSFEKLPFQVCIEGGRRGVYPEVFLQHYQTRCLIWDEDLYRSAVIDELIADWTLAAFLETP
jgi:hypothetical protein